MSITKKHTALALAGAALVGTLVYGEYQQTNPPGEESAMSNESEEIQRLRQSAARSLKYNEAHPEDEWNPAWRIKQILRGRAPDDPTITQMEKLDLQTWREHLQNDLDAASGKPFVVYRWMPERSPVDK